MSSVDPYTTRNGEKRWRVTYRTPEGKQTTKRGFSTKRDAQAFADTTAVAKLRGEYIDPRAGQVTVGQLAPEWLARQTHLKPSSQRVADVAWRVHVEPRWGRVKVADIRHSAVQQWIADMGRDERGTDGEVVKRGAGPVTVIRAFGILRSVLDEAVKDRRLIANPCAGVKLPRKGKRERGYLTDDQVWQLAREAGAGRAGSDKGVVVLVLAYCGLRWGELAGLHVADVDVLRRRITVRRNAVNVGGRVVVGTPKTHEQRVVPFPRFLVEPLAEVLTGKAREAIVFPAARGGYALSPGASTWFSSAVQRCQEQADEARAEESAEGGEPSTPEFPRVTPHDLRHTAASLAISAGANVKVVQSMLGHASAAMTLDTYADLFADDAEAVADAHDERVSAADVVNLLSPHPLRAVP